MYLIDRGVQCEINFNEIYEFPVEVSHFGLFICLCPVVVPPRQVAIYKSFVGQMCKCEVDSLSRSVPVFGCVNAKLLVKIGNLYQDIQQAFYESHLCPKSCAHCGGTQVQKLFIHAAFKQYKPESFPEIVSVRFEKKDRMSSTFWVVNKNIFTTVEKILKNTASKIMEYPLLQSRLEEGTMIRKIPCVAHTRAESSYKGFYRAVPAQYDSHTKRCFSLLYYFVAIQLFSIFLVDFGWFKWVLPQDLFDISTMHKSNPIRKLPVAMIHCKEDTGSVLHVENLCKGTNFNLKIKSRTCKDVYLVDLLDPEFVVNGHSSAGQKVNLISNLGTCKVTPSNSESITATRKQHSTPSMMLSTRNLKNSDATAKPTCLWSNYNFPTFSVPIMIPLHVPLVIPVLETATSNEGCNKNGVSKNNRNSQHNFMKNNYATTSNETEWNDSWNRNSNKKCRENSQNEWHRSSSEITTRYGSVTNQQNAFEEGEIEQMYQDVTGDRASEMQKQTAVHILQNFQRTSDKWL
ncbi:unnamed protein product [Thelazia callipaeda]|uniref:DUF4708 domain-containing protein n=1 Tax=Thelazia callipaeda TaxID=103827 RepID=A0A158RCU7_THECL|nr:unnamed protein product [Thelazia callipaeda]